jgi:hypothetical protein
LIVWRIPHSLKSDMSLPFGSNVVISPTAFLIPGGPLAQKLWAWISPDCRARR